MNLTYRQATIDDAGLLISLEAMVENPRLYGPTQTMPDAIRDITQNTFFFIYKGDTPVGTIAYGYVEDGGAYLSNVAVDPAYHRQGVARSAVLHCLAECGGAPSVTANLD